MLKKLSDNLNMLMAEARVNSSELARQTGIPPATIKRIKNNAANPTIETLLPIANYFSITISELIGDAARRPEKIIGLKKIPLFSWRDCVSYKQIDYASYAQHVFTERQISNQGFALQIENDDTGLFPQHAILLVEPACEPKSGDYVVAAKRNQGITSIRKYIIEIDHIYLKPLVNGINMTPLTDEFMIIGVIIQYKIELCPAIKME